MGFATPLIAAFDFSYFWKVVTPDELLWRAMWTTVYISIAAQLIGTLLGVLSATGSMSRYWPLRLFAGLYIWIFRGTPVFVQIGFWYFGSNLLFGFELIPRVLDLGFAELPGAVVAGIVALALNEGAYMSEIARAGIMSIEEGQTEAALVVGMTESEAMRRIVLPQAARVIVPGLGNEFNNMLKTSALVSSIGVAELYANGQVIYSRNFQYQEVFAAVAVSYLALTTVWTLIQIQIERWLGRSEREQDEPWYYRIIGTGNSRRRYS